MGVALLKTQLRQCRTGCALNKSHQSLQTTKGWGRPGQNISVIVVVRNVTLRPG